MVITKTGVFIVLFVLFMAFPFVLSVTRTITDTHDDLITFIVNSKGNYWEANGSYIQAAINDLNLKKPLDGGWGGFHGMVWLPANSTLVTNGTIVIEEHTTLDMQGSTVIPSGNFDVFELRVGSELRDGIVNVSSVTDYDSAVITFREEDYFRHEDHRAAVFDMELISDGLRGKGIHLETGDDYWQSVYSHFHNIKISEFEYGVLINHTKSSDGAYLNGNVFRNLYGYGNKYFITLNEKEWEISGTYFQNVYYNCTNETEYVIKSGGCGAVFENILTLNWDNKGGTRVAYNLTGPAYGHKGAHQSFISYRGGEVEVGTWSSCCGYPENTSNRYTILDLEKGNLTLGNVYEG